MELKTGDLVRDINDNECYLILKESYDGYLVLRLVDKHVDVRWSEELEVLSESR